MTEDDFSQKEILEKLYSYSLRFLGFRPRSRKEIQSYLVKKINKFCNKTQNLVNDVVGKLEKENLVNDEEFVDWWIDQRMEFNPKGKIALKKELCQKGVDKHLIEEKLAKIKSCQLAQAVKRVLEKKIVLYKELDGVALKDRLFKHLLRRGFSSSLALRMVDDFLKKR